MTRARERSAANPACTHCGEKPGSDWTQGLCEDCTDLCRKCWKAPYERADKLCVRCDGFRRWKNGVPPKFQAANMDAVRTQQPDSVVKPIDAYLAEPPGSLLLVGPVGVGKSYTVAAVLRAAMKSRPWITFNWTTAADMLQTLRPGREGIDRFQQAGVLVLDDIGRERLDTEWAAETCFMVIDYRWRNGLPVVATTNLEPKALSGVLGEAITDRLMDGATGVRFAGKSLRSMRSVD